MMGSNRPGYSYLQVYPNGASTGGLLIWMSGDYRCRMTVRRRPTIDRQVSICQWSRERRAPARAAIFFTGALIFLLYGAVVRQLLKSEARRSPWRLVA